MKQVVCTRAATDPTQAVALVDEALAHHERPGRRGKILLTS